MNRFRKAKNKNETLILFVTVIAIFTLLYFFYEFNPWVTLGLILLTLLYIRMAQGQFLGTSLQVSDKHFFRLKQIIEAQAQILQIKEPKLFIIQDPYPNAFTIGFRHPYTIVLNSSLVEDLTEEELESVIAHEMGHAKFNHPRISSLVNPAGQDIFILSQIFGFWRRSAELTADRIALLVSENPRAIVTSLIKISVGTRFLDKIDEEALLQQSQLVSASLLNKSGELLLDHPYLTKRINRNLSFAKENNYPYFKGGQMFCNNCGKKINVSAKFCPKCGMKTAR